MKEFRATVRGWTGTIEADSIPEAREEAQEMFDHETYGNEKFTTIEIEEVTSDDHSTG